MLLDKSLCMYKSYGLYYSSFNKVILLLTQELYFIPNTCVFITKRRFYFVLHFFLCVGGGMGGMNNMAGGMGMDRMGSGFDRMGPAMGGGLDRNMDIDRGFVPGPMGSGMRERLGSKGNQIFVRNVSN